MKFQVYLKDPDALYESIKHAVAEDVTRLPLSDDEKVSIADGRTENINELCRKWFKYGEYLTVEIDTEDETCRVVAAK